MFLSFAAWGAARARQGEHWAGVVTCILDVNRHNAILDCITEAAGGV